MKLTQTDVVVLRALFELASADVSASVSELARLVAASPELISLSLRRLGQQSLVDPLLVRLTMHGLVVAASVGKVAARRSELAA